MNTIKEMQCPECGHTESFNIEIGAICCVNIDGVQEALHGGDTDWGAENWCSCNECAFEGTVEDFLQTATEPGQHTPGPWFIEDGDVECVCAISPKGWLRTPKHPRYIVVQTGCYTSPPREVQAANARLIAAAPDLLAACKGLLCYANKYSDTMANKHGFGAQGLDELADSVSVAGMARAAIAKASPKC